MTDENADQIARGPRWAVVPNIDALGDGMFRPVRKTLDLTGFGLNVKVMQPGSSSRNHFHTEQQELIFVHAGSIEVEFGDGTQHQVGETGIVRIDAGEAHVVRVTSQEPAVLVMVGGKDGTVDGDAVFPD
jgi:uncharacterized cupin superfamily protein